MKRAVLTLLALVGAAVVPLAQTPADQLPPTFRAGVDVVQLDVTVLDKGRHPVTGLTAADFTILEHGRPQPIVAFSAIDVPAPVPVAGSWMRDAPLDVVSNDPNRRFVTIVMDDAYTMLEPDIMKRAKQIARNAVDELGPSDLAAVVFTYLGRAQNFTGDRSQLLLAVESFTPAVVQGEPPAACLPKFRSCDVETLATVASTLLNAPAGRKIVILITGGRKFSFGEVGTTDRNETPQIMEMFRDLQRANITVYAFDAHGLMVAGSPNESLYSFAESTGGRAFTNRNDPELRVSEAMHESSSYYLIGFQSTDPPADGAFRKIDVKVNRPGVQVRTRNGYFTAKKGAAAAAGAADGLPAGSLPLHVAAAAFARPGERDAEIIIASRIDPAGAAAARTDVELLATAIDTNGKSHGVQRQTIDYTTRAGGPGPDLPSHLPVPPGRYMVRIAASSGGRAGTVYVDVEVPDFAKSPLSLSGLLLHRVPAMALPDKGMAALVPAMPTTVRQFLPLDDVRVFLRVYQGGKGRLVPVRMTAKVTNDRDRATSNQEAMLEPVDFSATRSADYQIALPLAHLSSGQYLLEIEAQAGARRVKRSARFSVN